MHNLNGLQFFLFLSLLLPVFSPSGRLGAQTGNAPAEADTSILLGQVSVKAYYTGGKLRTIPGSISVLTGSTLSLSDGIQMMHTLNQMPGVTMQSGTLATSRIVIRGMGSRTPYNTNRIRAYLNDIPITGSDGISAPDEMDLSGLDRIEVIRGPSSALYGSGLGGSLSMYTRPTGNNDGKFIAQAGSFGTALLHASAGAEKGNTGFRLSGSHLQSAGFRENSRYRRSSLLSTIYGELNGWSLNGTFLISGIRGEIPSSLGLTLYKERPSAAAPNWKAVSGYQQAFRLIAGITLSGRLSGNIVNHLTLFGKWNDDFERRPFNDLDDRSASAGVRYKAMIHREKSEWIVGADWLTDQYDWELVKGGIRLNRNREIRTHYGVYVLGYFRPSPEWLLSAAGAVNQTRFRLTDLHPSNGDQSGSRKFPVMVSPRLGFSFAPGEKTVWYGSAGHGYSLPSPEETLLPEGEVNPGIKPEQGWQLETGIRRNLPDHSLWADVTVYGIFLNNLLTTKRITEDIFTGTNAGLTRHLGFEAMVGNYFFRLPEWPGQLSSSLSWTQSFNHFVHFSDGDSRYDGKELPGIPRFSLQYRVNWKPWSGVDWMTQLSLTGSQYLNDANTEQVKGWFLANTRMDVRLVRLGKGYLSLYAGLNNLSNSRYASMVVVNALASSGGEPRYYYPGTPRHAYAGAAFSF